MVRSGAIFKSLGAASVHAAKRLKTQCNFRGDEKVARRILNLCRKKAGKNGSLIISAENLGISREQMEEWGIPDNEFYVVFVWGKAPTVFQLGSPKRK